MGIDQYFPKEGPALPKSSAHKILTVSVLSGLLHSTWRRLMYLRTDNTGPVEVRAILIPDKSIDIWNSRNST